MNTIPALFVCASLVNPRLVPGRWLQTRQHKLVQNATDNGTCTGGEGVARMLCRAFKLENLAEWKVTPMCEFFTNSVGVWSTDWFQLLPIGMRLNSPEPYCPSGPCLGRPRPIARNVSGDIWGQDMAKSSFSREHLKSLGDGYMFQDVIAMRPVGTVLLFRLLVDTGHLRSNQGFCSQVMMVRRSSKVSRSQQHEPTKPSGMDSYQP